jgi:hypothetical protein
MSEVSGDEGTWSTDIWTWGKAVGEIFLLLKKTFFGSAKCQTELSTWHQVRARARHHFILEFLKAVDTFRMPHTFFTTHNARKMGKPSMYLYAIICLHSLLFNSHGRSKCSMCQNVESTSIVQKKTGLLHCLLSFHLYSKNGKRYNIVNCGFIMARYSLIIRLHYHFLRNCCRKE